MWGMDAIGARAVCIRKWHMNVIAMKGCARGDYGELRKSGGNPELISKHVKDLIVSCVTGLFKNNPDFH